MKKLIAMVVTALSLFGAEINWADSYDDALTQAEKENKKILVVIASEECRWCRKLISTTLKDAPVVERINREYVAVQVIRDKDSYPDELEALRVPMSYFLKPDGSVIHSMPGYWEAMDYLSILNDVDYKLEKQ